MLALGAVMSCMLLNGEGMSGDSEIVLAGFSIRDSMLEMSHFFFGALLRWAGDTGAEDDDDEF